MTEISQPLFQGRKDSKRSLKLALIALILIQGLCVAFFLDDIINDIAEVERGDSLGTHLAMEITANIMLVIGVIFGARMLLQLTRRQARDAERLALASGALHQLLLSWFQKWGLTTSEADVAMFTLKGLSIAEIAQVRSCAEGTVKAHLNAIYRKAGVSGRLQLQGLVVEELMATPLMPEDGPAETRGTPPSAAPAAAIVTGTGAR